jgi:beta-lactamase class A
MSAPDFQALFEMVDCTGSVHAVALDSGHEIGYHADTPVVMASIFKAIVALEFYAQSRAGLLDPAGSVDVGPASATPGPTGLSNFQDGARLSLRDLATQMMTVSDNAATDVVLHAVGIDAINVRAAACGCRDTHVGSDLQTMLDGVGREMDFADYKELLSAQMGALGDDARLRAHDAARLAALSAFDPARTTRTTARDMTGFLAAVWRDVAADPDACADLRAVMAQQVTRRLEAAVPDGGTLAAKSGGLFGRIRNEIAVIGYPDGASYAVAVFTIAAVPFRATAAINAQIARIAAAAIDALR